MIDWISAVVPLDTTREITGGKIVKFLPSEDLTKPPVIEWEISSRYNFEGSYSSNMTVRTVAAGEVEISGNPAKFFQGHNLFGGDDVNLLIYRFMTFFCKRMDIIPTKENEEAWITGRVELKRIDINYMLSFRDRDEVRTVLRALEPVAVPYRGRATNMNGTLYWGNAAHGKRAKDWMIKMYCKADELGMGNVPKNADDWEVSKVKDFAGKLPKQIYARSELCLWVDNKLRVELTLRKKELCKIGHKYATSLTPAVVREIFNCYVSRLKIGDVVAYTINDVERLPRALRATFNLWKMGIDVRTTLSRTAFFRHKKEIFNQLGVDVGIVQPKEARIIPLRQIVAVNFEPAPIPAFAHGTPNLIEASAFERELFDRLDTRKAA